jgi:phosphate transport system protein
MLRSNFERELHRLQDQILTLGNEVEWNLVGSVNALIKRDLARSREYIEADRRVNDKRIKIGLDVLTVIATQQPLAGDMRLLAAVLEIVGELERIHDYVKGIGRISLMLGEETVLKPVADILPQMAQITRQMLHSSLDAFTSKDSALARRIPATDNEVDDLYNQAYRAVIHSVMEDPTSLAHAHHLEWAIHNVERSADRVINICEWIVYMTAGEYVEMDTEYEAPPSLEQAE